MSGTKIEQSKNLLQLFLRSLPLNCHFNIISFGSGVKVFSSQSVVYDEHTMQKASIHVQEMEADMGGTDLLAPLKHVLSLSSSSLWKRVFILTDGYVENREQVIQFTTQSQSQNWRIFGFAIGSSSDVTLIHTLANIGRGSSEYSKHLFKKLLSEQETDHYSQKLDFCDQRSQKSSSCE